MPIFKKPMRFCPPLCLAFLLLSCSSKLNIDKRSGNLEVFDPEARLAAMGIQLPLPSSPVANYVNAVSVRGEGTRLVFLAGKGPSLPEGGYITGKVGADLSVEQGYQAARLTALHQLAALKAEIGDLKKVRRIVKVLGMVNSNPDFSQHPEVVNGFSDAMVAVFGERGKHARSAVGMISLPRNMCVEVEMIVEVEK
jgi:enamine deaminase RidA (YjgF/YER057c/UK114 family)